MTATSHVSLLQRSIGTVTVDGTTVRGEGAPSIPNSSCRSPSSVVWDEKDGEYAEIAVFWATNHLTLKVDVNTSTWVDVILPGLGYDRLRLVEVTFPPTLPDQPGAAAEFDRARHALDSRHYEECVAACHGLLSV